MYRRAVRLAAVALMAGAVFVAAVAVRPASNATAAAAAGPPMALGTTVGSLVSVNATAASPNAYRGFNIHVSAAVLGTLTGLTITPDVSGSVLPGSPFCVTNSISPSELVYACSMTGAGGITTQGLLAHFGFSATGNGCVIVSLITAPGSDVLDTYTVNATDYLPQQNAVDTVTTTFVRFGTGALGCPLQDSDGDGYTDAREIALGKDPFTYCRIMRADVNGDGVVNSIDLAKTARNYGPHPGAREDQNADGVINSIDLLAVAQLFNGHVTECT